MSTNVTKGMDKADVSVIIPACQAQKTIARALRSVASQTQKPRQIIVVDDGSTDATLREAEKFRDQFSDLDFVLITQQNQGAGAARNRALAQATSTYVAFLDGDDEWLPQKLQRSLAHFDKPGVVLVAHNYIRVSPGKPDAPVDCFRHFDNSDDPYVTLYRRGYVATSTVVARRDAVAAAGGFEATLSTAQDFDLWLKMLATPEHSLTLFDEALSRYHVVAGSITSHTQRRLTCTLQIANRHFTNLGKRSGSAMASLWFRVAAVHYEAFTAYRSRNNTLKAGLVLGRLPGHLAAASLDALIGEGVKPGRIMAAVLATWIGVIAFFYVFQFRHLIDPILQVLGV